MRSTADRLRMAIGMVVAVMIVGTLGYWAFGFTLLDAAYQTITTITTVGFRELQDFGTGTGASTRTLHRAFAEVLEDTPQNYIRRLRLHRIRRELISCEGTSSTIARAGMRWGAGSDLGRFSARYRGLFGENPSATLAYGRARASETEPLKEDWHELRRRAGSVPPPSVATQGKPARHGGGR